MYALQLEFSLEDQNSLEIKVEHLQKEIQDMRESTRKCLKKQFLMLSEMSKENFYLKEEVYEMRKLLRELGYEKDDWEYEKGGYLFNVQKHRERAG